MESAPTLSLHFMLICGIIYVQLKPKEVNTMGDNRQQNCLGFVTGIFGYERLKELVPSQFVNPELPPPQPPEAEPAVIVKMNELGFECRKVNEDTPLSEEEDKIVFFGPFAHVEYFWGQGTCSFNFHFAKYDDDGHLHHKWGWGAPPTEISLAELVKEYGQPPMFFAIRKRTL